MKTKLFSMWLSMILVLTLSVRANAQLNVSVNFAPPAIPTYTQVVCPGDGYIWVPGYWAYDANYGYYWVPGYWTYPPSVGMLWTPGYWGFTNNVYMWNSGYWGRTIGFYGGVNYGYGYFGHGYYGGRWNGNTFVYNTAVNNINTTVIHNTYIDRAYNDSGVRTSFNGKGGIKAMPNAQEKMVMNDRHVNATDAQRMHNESAKNNTDMRFKTNQGAISQNAIQKEHQNFQIRANDPSNHPAMSASPNAPRAMDTRPEVHEMPKEARPEPMQMPRESRPMQSAPRSEGGRNMEPREGGRR